MLDLAAHLRLPPDAAVSRLVQKDVGGRATFCVDVSPTSDLWQKDLVGKARDQRSGPFEGQRGHAVLRRRHRRPRLRGVRRRHATVRVPMAGHARHQAYPKTLRCYEGKELAAEATVEELVAQDAPQPEGNFAPPAGAEKWPVCGRSSRRARRQAGGGRRHLRPGAAAVWDSHRAPRGRDRRHRPRPRVRPGEGRAPRQRQDGGEELAVPARHVQRRAGARRGLPGVHLPPVARTTAPPSPLVLETRGAEGGGAEGQRLFGGSHVARFEGSTTRKGHRSRMEGALGLSQDSARTVELLGAS